MRVPLLKRLAITTLNIIFPPLAVALLTGPTSRDTLLNACLFLLAVIPSHIHGFYISAVYFTRKRRVRNGRWPGSERKSGVWSERVLTGGVGWDGARALKEADRGGKETGRVDGGESDFDNKWEKKRYGKENRERKREAKKSMRDGRRSSKRASKVQSRVQEPVETQMSTQETGQITDDGAQHSRTSRWVEGL